MNARQPFGYVLKVESMDDHKRENILSQLRLDSWDEYNNVRQIHIATNMPCLPELPSDLVTLYITASVPLDLPDELPEMLETVMSTRKMVRKLPVVWPERLKWMIGVNLPKVLLIQHNKRCVDLGLKKARGDPGLMIRLDVKKKHDAWRFRLDGPEWKEAVCELDHADRMFTSVDGTQVSI